MARQTNSTITRLALQNTSWQFKYFTKTPEQNSIYIYQNIQLVQYFEEIIHRLGLSFHNLTLLKNDNRMKLIISYYTTNKFLKPLNWYKIKLSDNHNKKRLKNIINCKKSILFKKSLTKTIFERKSLLGYVLKSLNNFKRFNMSILLKFRQINKNNNFYLSRKDLFNFKRNLLFLRRFYRRQYYKGIINSILVTIKLANCAKFFTNILSQEMLLAKRHTALLFFVKQSLNLFINARCSKLSGLKVSLKGKLKKSGRASQRKLAFGVVSSQVFLSKLAYAQKTLFLKTGTISLKTWINEKSNF